MKIFFTSIVFALGLTVSAQDKMISFEELPASVKTFVSNHFSKENVASVVLDRGLISDEYSIFMNDGTQVEFDSKGQWTEMKSSANEVLKKFIPAKISDYISQKYPSVLIKEIKNKRNNFEVELSNGLDLVFDKKGQFLRFED